MRGEGGQAGGRSCLPSWAPLSVPLISQVAREWQWGRRKWGALRKQTRRLLRLTGRLLSRGRA